MLEEIRNFLVTAECLSFTTASKFLYIAQPALSKQISRLEEELGVKLFSRTTRSVSLTPAGEAFQKCCHVFTKHCETLPTNFPRNSLVDNDQGLIVGIGRNMDTDLVIAVVSNFIHKHEKVSITFTQKPDEELVKMLMSGDADFIYTFLPILQDASDFDYAVIKRVHLNVVLWESHPLAAKEKVKVSDLKNEFFIMNSAAPAPLMEMLHHLCEVNGFFPKVSAKVDTPQLSMMMTSAEQGITLTTFRVPDGSVPSNLVFRAIDDTDVPKGFLENSLVLAWRKDRYFDSDLIRQFADSAKAMPCLEHID